LHHRNRIVQYAGMQQAVHLRVGRAIRSSWSLHGKSD
jgi:hypothetical protein